MGKTDYETPYKDLLPPLSSAEFAALKADYQRHGPKQKVELDENGNVLDGHHRLKIDPNWPTVVIRGLTDAEKEAHVLRSNSIRRNLSPEQEAEVRARKKETAFKLREQDAKKWTQKAVAEVLGVAQNTVSTWFSNITSDKAKPADARLSIPREAKAEIVRRVDKGEPQVKVAAELKISKGRVSQIVKAAKKKEENVAKQNAIAMKAVEGTFNGLYDVIVIDPPWPMEKIEREVAPEQSAFDYPTMSEDELSAMKLPAKADCHLWIWTTHKFLPMALRLLDAWKFKYVCTFVWHKPGGFQPFGLPQYNCEFALYARKGSPSFVDTKAFNVCFDAPRGAHSEKPEAFYEVVRRVTSGDRIDIFNRREIKGFEVWGNESSA